MGVERILDSLPCVLLVEHFPQRRGVRGEDLSTVSPSTSAVPAPLRETSSQITCLTARLPLKHFSVPRCLHGESLPGMPIQVRLAWIIQRIGRVGRANSMNGGPAVANFSDCGAAHCERK